VSVIELTMDAPVISSDQQQDRIEGEATEWLVLQTAGRLEPPVQQAFDAWLARSAQNRAAYDHVRRVWDDLALLQQEPGDLLRHTAALQPRRIATRRLAAPWIALAASLLLALGLAWVRFGNPATALLADYRTMPGEIRTVLLPDGSRADLGPSSAIRLQFTGSERRIELLAGSAFFEAVPQAMAGGRPFIVDSASLSARALGTRFVVERLAGRDDVAVVEHDVEVTMTWPDGGRHAVTLSPGQTLRYRRDAGAADLGTADPQAVAAWRTGSLVFYRMPLQEVVAELNRYRRSRIVIAGDDLAGRVVSGVFRASDPDGALEVITQELAVQTRDLGLAVVLYK
jgi:transmembrane sensor